MWTRNRRHSARHRDPARKKYNAQSAARRFATRRLSATIFLRLLFCARGRAWTFCPSAAFECVAITVDQVAANLMAREAGSRWYGPVFQ